MLSYNCGWGNSNNTELKKLDNFAQWLLFCIYAALKQKKNSAILQIIMVRFE